MDCEHFLRNMVGTDAFFRHYFLTEGCPTESLFIYLYQMRPPLIAASAIGAQVSVHSHADSPL